MKDVKVISACSLCSTGDLRAIISGLEEEYVCINTSPCHCELGYLAYERFKEVAGYSGADMLYSDYYELVISPEGGAVRKPHPLIDYQEGSLRDDFDFGAILFFESAAFIRAVAEMDTDYRFGALYDLRLRMHRIVHINECLYTKEETDSRKSGEKQFDYVNPRNREVQIEMEKICAEYLKRAGAFLKPSFKSISGIDDQSEFPVTASVIIPVFNRVRTISDAVKSALSQNTDFSFNVIVVDNHSTDGTSSILAGIKDPRLIVIVPERDDLGIGGCWNLAINDNRCGIYAVQLDSDDIYKGDNTLQLIINVFRNNDCAMVIGSYEMTDFNLNILPPGLIDHKEWTEENGRNNALRINGLGAPRAFLVPVIRKIMFPNVSYGEDYAAVLRISREYRIERIYEPIYCCRRWEGNSDASLDILRVNSNNHYKDSIRTWEFQARKEMNAKFGSDGKKH